MFSPPLRKGGREGRYYLLKPFLHVLQVKLIESARNLSGLSVSYRDAADFHDTDNQLHASRDEYF